MLPSLFARKHFKKKGKSIEEVLHEIVGHVVQCEDGVFRRVFEACTPVGEHQAKGFIIINEHDPHSKLGYYVHMLTVQCALDGLPPPTREAKEAATRLWGTLVKVNAKSLHEAQRKGKLPFDFNE